MREAESQAAGLGALASGLGDAEVPGASAHPRAGRGQGGLFFVFAFLDWVGGWDVWSVSLFVGWDVFGEGFGVPKRNKTTAVPNLLDFLDTLC